MAGLILKEGMTVEMSVLPGKNYEKSLPLLNSGSQPLDIAIYQRDYFFNSDGQNRYDLPGTLERSNAPWVQVNQRSLRLLPQESSRIPYVVTVPNQPALNGSYWSVVLLELQDHSPVEKGKPKQLLRYAVQVITHISSAAGESDIHFYEKGLKKLSVDRAPASEIPLKKKVTAKTHALVYQMDLVNKGNRAIRPSIWLEIYDQQGNPAHKVGGDAKTIYPETSVRFQANLEHLAAGNYTGVVMADGGNDNNLFGTEVELNIP